MNMIKNNRNNIFKLSLFCAAVLSLMLLASCSNMFQTKRDNPASKSQLPDSEMGIITVKVNDGNARTILPSTDDFKVENLTNIKLEGSWQGGETQTVIAECTNWTNFQANATTAVQTGNWIFTLTAKLGNVTFTGTQGTSTAPVTIVKDTATTLNFTLTTTTTYGGLSLGITVASSEATTIDATLKTARSGGSVVDEQTLTLSAGAATYAISIDGQTSKNQKLTAGTYYLELDFKTSDTLTVFNTWKGVVRIVAGITTTATISWDLDTVYTITWELDDGQLAGTYVQHEKFTRKSNSITLPTDAQITHPDGYTFGGWYDNSAFSGDPITEIDFTNPSNIKPWNLHAKWVYKVIYKDSVDNDIDVLVQTYNKGETTTRPADNPTHAGYAFDDYYADAACTEDNEFTFGTVLTSNTTVYARFYNTLYVKYGATYTTEGGDRESESLVDVGYALDRIIAINQPADWIIQVSGSWDGHSYTLFRDTITTDNASSITVQGKTGNNTDILDRGCGTNKANDGYLFNIVTAVPVTIKNIQLTGAYVNGSGGGITVGANANVTLGEGALIQGNKAGTNGGGIYVAGNTESLGKLTILSGAVISGNSVDTNTGTNTASYNGGGIYNRGIVVMKGGTINGNKAIRGAGVYNDGNTGSNPKFYMSGDACIGDSTMHTPYYASATNYSNSTYTDNVTNPYGGGIYNYAGTVKLGVTCNLDTMEEEDELLTGGICYNYAKGWGGGIYSSSTANGEANIVIKSGNISYNACGDGGGGLYFTSSTASLVSIVEMSGGTISQNYVPIGKKGGAVVLSAGMNANTFLFMSGAANIPKSEDHNNYIAFTSSSNTYGGIMISGALSSSSGPFMLDAASCTTANFNPTSLINKYGSVSNDDFNTAVSKFNLSYVACIGSTNYYTQKDAYDAILAAEGNNSIELGEACTGFMLGNSQTSSGNKLAYAMKANTTASTFALYVQNGATIQLQADSSNLLKDCVKFTGMDIRGFDTSLVTKFDSMFEGCYNVRYIYLSTFTNTSAQSAISMFKGCENLGEIIATADFDLSTKLDATTGENIFNGCNSLTGGSGSAYTTYGDGYSYAKLDSGSSSPGYFKSN